MASFRRGTVGATRSEHKASSVRFSAGFVPQDFLDLRDGTRAAPLRFTYAMLADQLIGFSCCAVAGVGRSCCLGFRVQGLGFRV